MSTSGYGGVPLREALRDFEMAGITNVELSVGAPGDKNTATLLDKYIEKGFKFIPHHNAPIDGRSHPIDLCKDVPEAYLHNVFEFCISAGSPHYSVHGGSFSSDEKRQVAFGKFILNINKVNQMAAQYGTKVAVETMYPTRTGAKFVLSSETEVKIFNQMFPDIPFILDFAHLQIMIQQGTATPKLIQYMLDLPNLLEIHISENDGVHDHHTPVTRQSYFWNMLQSRPDVPVVMEGRLNKMGYETLRDNYQMVLSLL
jgi:sugar phosphate isomerase/epimerase